MIASMEITYSEVNKNLTQWLLKLQPKNKTSMKMACLTIHPVSILWVDLFLLQLQLRNNNLSQTNNGHQVLMLLKHQLWHLHINQRPGMKSNSQVIYKLKRKKFPQLLNQCTKSIASMVITSTCPLSLTRTMTMEASSKLKNIMDHHMIQLNFKPRFLKTNSNFKDK